MNAIILDRNSAGPSKFATDQIECLFKRLELNDFSGAFEIIQMMISNEEFSFLPDLALKTFGEVCFSQNWDALAPLFVNKEFIGKDGYFIWFSPFSIRREGKIFCELTGIFGKVLDLHPIPDFDFSKYLNRLQKKEEIPGEILSVESILTFGFTGTERGEAFLVPNGWGFKKSKYGPALNDLLQQRSRFLKIGKPAIEKIFDSETAEYLLSWVENKHHAYKTQSREYQYHEFGHFTGISLNNKIANKAFLTPWYAAVEEWRSDGVAFELASKTLSQKEAALMIAANLCLRFGIDAQRIGGSELDSDVNAALILFDRLFQSGAMSISKDFKLRLKLESIEDLLTCVYPSMSSALELTKSEMLLLNPKGIWNLYGCINVSPSSRNLFELFVRNPCLKQSSQLR